MYFYIKVIILGMFIRQALLLQKFLPNDVKPIRYNLTIEPHFDQKNSSFTGNVAIDIEVQKTVTNITLHSEKLSLSSADITVTNVDNLVIKCNNISYDTDNDFVSMHFDDLLLEGRNYTLQIPFVGIFTKCAKTIGLYVSSYGTENGESREYALTNFEPSGARKAFPCFDEPSLKAAFIINIIRPAGFNSISNEAQEFTKDLGNGFFQDSYKETPRMSTYLVSFMISDFEYVTAAENVRIFAQPVILRKNKLSYAANISKKILQKLEEYLGVNYTLSKMDMAIVPSQCFYSEAVENWGFVLFNDKNVLFSNSSKSLQKLQTIYIHIAHEFSHQWFGNLVTLNWWSYLWLNEGFGTFMSYYIPSLLKPKWQLMDQFVIQILHEVLKADNDYQQPLLYKDASPNDMPNPWISYYKASSIIRMMQNFLTGEIFQESLNLYLNSNKFENVESADLYSSMQTIIDKENKSYLLGNNNVKSIMETWENFPGFPLITITRNYQHHTTTFKQEKYMDATSSQIWYVPINYAQPKSKNKFKITESDLWLTEKEVTIQDDFLPNEFLLANIQQTGYYRVNYDLTNWQQITQFLITGDFHLIPIVNRAQLLDDSFALAYNNYISYDVPLNLTMYLYREKEYVPWHAFFTNLEDISYYLQNCPEYNKFENYIQYLLRPLYEHLTFFEKPIDSHLDRLNRPLLLKWLCKVGHKECQKNALKILEKIRKENYVVSSELKPTIYSSGIKEDITGEEWTFLFDKLNRSDDQEKDIILQALGCTKNETILYNLLELILNTTTDFSSYERQLIAINILSCDAFGLEFVKNYLQQHKEKLKTSSTLRTLTLLLRRELTTSEQLDQINEISQLAYEEMHLKYPSNEETLSWMNKKHLPEILNWFRLLQL